MTAENAKRTRIVQAWIAPLGDDPEAVSALAVMRERLPEARGLAELRRRRVVELRGALPASGEVGRLLAESTQFYNPHKERCTVRGAARTRAPLGDAQAAVLVWERGGERRPTAERWWRHATGRSIEVVEGVAWLLTFDGDEDARAHAESIARLRGRRHGLLCNPHAQAMAVAGRSIPLPWLANGVETRNGRRTRRESGTAPPRARRRT